MILKRDYSKQDHLARIIQIIYMYSLMNIKKSLWLSGQEEVVYANMLDAACAPNIGDRRGWVSTLEFKGLKNKSLKYIYLDRIKKKKWIKKNGKAFVFPPNLLDIVRAVKRGEEVIFDVKA